jgi:hypothetical protein
MRGPDNLSKSFGLAIAFLIPGVVGLYALSFFAPAVQEWFGIAAKGSTSIGGFLFVVLGSIGMGVFISGLRWLVLEQWLAFVQRRPLNLDDARRRDEKCEAAYQDLLFRHYQFYQFYANMPFALGFAYIAWFVAEGRVGERAFWLLLLMLIADGVLLACAKNAITAYAAKVSGLLGIRDLAA